MKITKLTFFLGCLIGGIGASAVPLLLTTTRAETRLLPFHGRLTDATGSAIPDGSKVVEFKMYDAPTGGTVKWAGEVHKLSVNGGTVNTMLGGKASLGNVDFSTPTYLQITVDTQSAGTPGNGVIDAADPPLLPRQSVIPSIFATEAGNSRLLSGYRINELPANIPIGGIIMWWGSKNNLPEGFELCNGEPVQTQNTQLSGLKPNFKDKFPKGAIESAVDVSISPIFGGSNQTPEHSTGPTSLSEDQLPVHSHAHSFSIPKSGFHTHSVQTDQTSQGEVGVGRFTGGGGAKEPSGMTVSKDGSDHSHAINGSIIASGKSMPHSHSIPSHDNRPAFIEVFFIIRVK